jgi:hypothetical protein
MSRSTYWRQRTTKTRERLRFGGHPFAPTGVSFSTSQPLHATNRGSVLDGLLGRVAAIARTE